jgi:hypothetical protein
MEAIEYNHRRWLWYELALQAGAAGSAPFNLKAPLTAPFNEQALRAPVVITYTSQPINNLEWPDEE